MNNPIRRKQVAKAVLEALSMAGGYALEVSRLWNFVNDLVKPEVKFAEQGVVIKMLADGGYVRRTTDDLDPGMELYVITDLGRNYLASL